MSLKQYSILKIKMSNFKNNSGNYNLDVTTKYYRKLKTIGKESELFRIVNYLHMYYKANNVEIEDDIDSNETYPLIQDLLSVHINKKTKKYYENSNGILKVNYIDYEDKEKKKKKETLIVYKRLLASSGHVRNQKIIYINEKMYNDALEILLCGMNEDIKFEKLAKFNSYFGLVSTDGVPVEMPNILVIPDFKNEIEEQFDIVDEYEKDKYKVDHNVIKKTTITPFDGAGLVDIRRVIKWCRNELNLKYIPSSLLIRALPGIKGNIYTVDLKKYIQEKGITKVKDLWDKEIDLVDENGNLLVDCVLTKSMIKFSDRYNSYEDWLNSFNTEVKGYKRTFNICKWSENFKELKHTVPLSYQPLQSLDLSHKDIEKLCKDTIKTITRISNNVDEFIKFRGIDRAKDKTLPEYYRILEFNKGLFYDPWLQKKIQQDIDGFKKRTYLGGILCNGNYQVLGVDVVGLLQHALGLEVTGILRANEVYSNYWTKKGINKVAIIRFPHVSHEWKISNVVKPEYSDTEYMKYQRATICASIWDSTDIRLGGADHDNDHVVSLSNTVLIQAAQNNKYNINTILPDNSYKEGKEDNANKRRKKTPKINNVKQLIKTDCNAMRNSIGVFVNEITKLWSLEQTPEIKKYIKIMSVICSKAIDFAKTGVPAKIPAEIKEVLERNKNLPYFMQYRYPEKVTEQNRINANLELLGEKPISMFTDTDCTMNRICHYLEEKVGNIKLEVPQGVFDFSMFYKKRPDKYHDKYYKLVLSKLRTLKNEHDSYAAEESDCFSKDEKMENVNQYRLFYDYCKNSMLAICSDIDRLIDILIFAFYEDKKFYDRNPDKAILYNCFGTRLRNRLEGITRVIPTYDATTETKIAKKKKKKLIKNKNKNREVSFALYKDGQYIDIVNNIDIGLTKEEIRYIKDKAVSSESRRLLYSLLLLDKTCAKYNSDFRIFYATKNKTKIKKNDICNLARINDKQYKKHMDFFRKNGIITLSTNGKKTYLICKVNSPSKGEPVHIIKNLNKSKEYFKKIC